ncbi:hypothetical protein MBLNU13_g02148t1 [Cladosporium sp. NU13]
MSYNTSDPNQQWQPPVDTNNQQKLHSFSQQATLSSPTSGGGSYQQSQRSYTWADGNTQGQHHSSQQSWSWQGQTHTPANQSPPAFSTPSISTQSTFHHQLHQQRLQNAMNHSQQAFAIHQQAMNMHHNMATSISNMTPIVQQTSQPQIMYQSMSPQPQQVYQQSALQSPLPLQPQVAQQPQQPALLMDSQPQSPMPTTLQQRYTQHQQTYSGSPLTSPGAVQPQLQYQQSIYQQSIYQQTQLPQSPLPHASQQALQQAAQQAPQQTPLARHTPQSQQTIQQLPHDHRFFDNMNCAGAEIYRFPRDLELDGTSVQSSHEGKDQEVRRLQEQLAAVERQRRLDAERNSQKLAELVRSQATSPSTQTPALDMSALQRVIRETQSQQLSVQDIERVVEEQVSKRLAGMATKANIQNAGAQMQTALSQVPAGLNEEQVQQAVNRELNHVMQDLANRTNQQRRIAWQRQQDPQLWQTPQHNVQTDFVIEELPDEVTVIHPHGAVKEAKPQSALRPGGNQNAAASRITPGAGQYGTASPTSAYNEVQSTSQGALVTSQYAGGSQYVAIEARNPRASVEGSQQANVPVSSIPASHRHAAIEAQPMAPNVPGNALAPANTILPTGASHSAMPYASSLEHYGAAPGQLQLTPTHGWGASSSDPIGFVRPQGQLEAAPVQMQQIAGDIPQLQLEVPSSSSTGYPTTGQELVHQSRDLEKQPPRR